MRLSDLALDEKPEGEAEEGGADGMFEDAAIEAFDLFKQGKKSEAAAALKGAIEACVAEYMADEE